MASLSSAFAFQSKNGEVWSAPELHRIHGDLLVLAGNASDFYREAPWMVIFPGLAISLAVFAFNLLGDSLRDWLDPKFKT